MRKNPNAEYSIYRVGPAWMFTTENRHIVQAKYRVPIQDWQRVTGD